MYKTLVIYNTCIDRWRSLQKQNIYTQSMHVHVHNLSTPGQWWTVVTSYITILVNNGINNAIYRSIV